MESDLNQSNTWYRIKDLAIIHKKPTPIQVVSVSYPKRSAAKITEAYYNIPSTTDYCGVYKGSYIDFEAKETQSTTRFDFSLLHPHQYKHLNQVLNHGGIAFLIVRFTRLKLDYFINMVHIIEFRSNSTRASLPLEWIKTYGLAIGFHYKAPCDYLKVLNQMMTKETL